MPNTLHGPYAKTVWTNGSTPISQTNLNNLETQGGVALASFNPDLITAAFILSGVACVKDATTASQLNITSGEAYLLMSDGTYARIDVAATTQSASGHASSTLYLYLQPDGTWYWNTANSPAANSLAICTVTTDGSSNISGVTDKRNMLAQALTGAAHMSATQPGGLALPAPLAATLTQNASLAAVVNGGVTFAQVGALSCSMDTAASFNGSTGYISVPTSGLPSGGAAFSLETWIKLAANPASAGPILVLGQSGNRAFFQVNSAGTVSVGSGATITSAGSLSLNVWHHLVATYDGTTLTLYVDGASVASGASSSAITYGNTWIGQSLSGAFLAGLLDEVAIYGAALSSARVSAHYSAGTSTTSEAYAASVLADAPLRYYRLGDASGASSAACAQSATTTTLFNADGTQPSVALAGGGSIDHEGAFVVYRSRESGAADGHLFQTWTGSTSSNAFGVGTASVASVTGTAVNDAGVFAKIAGQATAGSLGASVVVAVSSAVTITDKVDHTILSFTPTVTGFYRASIDLVSGAETGFAATFTVVYKSGIDGSGGTQPVTVGNGYPTLISVYAQASNAITVHYQNTSTGSPINDKVIAILERLS